MVLLGNGSLYSHNVVHCNRVEEFPALDRRITAGDLPSRLDLVLGWAELKHCVRGLDEMSSEEISSGPRRWGHCSDIYTMKQITEGGLEGRLNTVDER